MQPAYRKTSDKKGAGLKQSSTFLLLLNVCLQSPRYGQSSRCKVRRCTFDCINVCLQWVIPSTRICFNYACGSSRIRTQGRRSPGSVSPSGGICSGFTRNVAVISQRKFSMGSKGACCREYNRKKGDEQFYLFHKNGIKGLIVLLTLFTGFQLPRFNLAN